MSLINSTNSVFNALIIYILIMALLFITKPRIFFNKDNRMKHFGFNNYNSDNESDTTLLSLPLFGILLAMILYLIFSLVETFCSKVKNGKYQYNKLSKY